MALPVFILSLEDAVVRRAPLIADFFSRGVPYEIWNAVDGRYGWPAIYDRLVSRDAARHNLGREIGTAELACSLSHHLIYRAVIERRLNAAVILEDDAIVGDRFFDFLQRGQYPKCDLLLLDHSRALVRRTGQLNLSEGTILHRCACSPHKTTGYLVTQEGASRLVDHSTPVAGLADWPMDISVLRTYAASPKLVDHPDDATAASDIRENRQKLQIASKRRDPKRFLKLSYWQKTLNKRFGKWVS
ncbi:MAG: glycosyltransferase family 25 protein [Loktanella sp.]|nr:glycosyltransferase family 25 protein [Loktanella sp.]